MSKGMSIYEVFENPMNKRFFSDDEVSFRALKRSIMDHGYVIDPIIITPECMLISGHRRVRASKEILEEMRDELSKKEINDLENIRCETEYFDSDDDATLRLIELNVTQRNGHNSGGTPEQIADRCDFVEEKYNAKRRAAGEKDLTNEEVAKLAGVKPHQLYQARAVVDIYKKYPETKSAVECGNWPETALFRLGMVKDEGQQKDVIDLLGIDNKITVNDMLDAIEAVTGKKSKSRRDEEDRINAATNEIQKENNTLSAKVEGHKEEIEKKNREIEALKRENEKLKSAPENNERPKRERGKMAYELCQEEEYGGTAETDVHDELSYTMIGHMQSFINVFNSIMNDGDFKDRFLGLSQEDRDEINDNCNAIVEIMTKLSAIQ